MNLSKSMIGSLYEHIRELLLQAADPHPQSRLVQPYHLGDFRIADPLNIKNHDDPIGLVEHPEEAEAADEDP